MGRGGYLRFVKHPPKKTTNLSNPFCCWLHLRIFSFHLHGGTTCSSLAGPTKNVGFSKTWTKLYWSHVSHISHMLIHPIYPICSIGLAYFHLHEFGWFIWLNHVGLCLHWASGIKITKQFLVRGFSPTHLKNMLVKWWSPQGSGWTYKNIWNHHVETSGSPNISGT